MFSVQKYAIYKMSDGGMKASRPIALCAIFIKLFLQFIKNYKNNIDNVLIYVV